MYLIIKMVRGVALLGMSLWIASSAPCPEETPESSSLFCDEPFGPGFFDGGLSDTCVYGVATCCESTGDCVSAFNCGCNVAISEVSCGPFIACPDFCPEATPETGNGCDVPLNVDCLYDFGECGFSPEESTTVCFCENGAFVCTDFCDDGSSPTAPPIMEDTGMEGGMMGMSGGMKDKMMGGGMGGMKMGSSSKSKEARSLGFTMTSTTHKHRHGVFRGS